MGKRTKRVNHRLVIEPPHPGDFGFCFIGGETRTEQETIQLLEQMQDDVIRHVDGAKRKNVRIESDDEVTCEFCGSSWTEGDSPHNGGCCAKDEEVMVAEEEIGNASLSPRPLDADAKGNAHSGDGVAAA